MTRKFNDSLYEDVLPFVLEDVNKLSAQQVLAVLVAANSVGVKKNQVKRLLQELAIKKVQTLLAEHSSLDEPLLRATLYGILKALRPLLWKQEQAK